MNCRKKILNLFHKKLIALETIFSQNNAVFNIQFRAHIDYDTLSFTVAYGKRSIKRPQNQIIVYKYLLNLDMFQIDISMMNFVIAE